jgi:CspA family cold shock protein
MQPGASGANNPAVEKAGLDGLPDGAKVTFDIVPNRGKESAENLRVK